MYQAIWERASQMAQSFQRRIRGGGLTTWTMALFAMGGAAFLAAGLIDLVRSIYSVNAMNEVGLAGVLLVVQLIVMLPTLFILAERNRLLDSLRQSNEMHQILAESSADAIVRIGLDGVRTYASPAVKNLLGWEPVEIIGQSRVKIIHPEDQRSMVNLLESAAQNNWHIMYPLRMRRKDGEYRWVEANIRVIVDRDQRPIELISTLRDVHDRVIREQQLEAEKHHAIAISRNDALTGLANRYNLDIELFSAWKRMREVGGELACIMIDVDYFKSLNDTYGHPEGDECLRMIGFAIVQGVRGRDDIAARYGGEEFCILLYETDMRNAVTVAERIRSIVEKFAYPHEVSPCGHVTVSIGVATSRSCGVSGPNELVVAADQALYRAKSSGRNCVVCADEKPPLAEAA